MRNEKEFYHFRKWKRWERRQVDPKLSEDLMLRQLGFFARHYVREVYTAFLNIDPETLPEELW